MQLVYSIYRCILYAVLFYILFLLLCYFVVASPAFIALSPYCLYYSYCLFAFIILTAFLPWRLISFYCKKNASRFFPDFFWYCCYSAEKVPIFFPEIFWYYARSTEKCLRFFSRIFLILRLFCLFFVIYILLLPKKCLEIIQKIRGHLLPLQLKKGLFFKHCEKMHENTKKAKLFKKYNFAL